MSRRRDVPACRREEDVSRSPAAAIQLWKRAIAVETSDIRASHSRSIGRAAATADEVGLLAESSRASLWPGYSSPRMARPQGAIARPRRPSGAGGEWRERRQFGRRSVKRQSSHSVRRSSRELDRPPGQQAAEGSGRAAPRGEIGRDEHPLGEIAPWPCPGPTCMRARAQRQSARAGCNRTVLVGSGRAGGVGAREQLDDARQAVARHEAGAPSARCSTLGAAFRRGDRAPREQRRPRPAPRHTPAWRSGGETGEGPRRPRLVSPPHPPATRPSAKPAASPGEDTARPQTSQS